MYHAKHSNHQKTHPYDVYRKLVRMHWYPKLSKKCAQLKQEGLYPFEGEWYSEAEIVERKKALKQQDHALLLDLAIVFGIAIGSIAFLILILLFVL